MKDEIDDSSILAARRLPEGGVTAWFAAREEPVAA
jgi:hypothetical protein